MSKALLDEIRNAYHGIFGIPDYDAYLRHMAQRHPGEPPLARGEFARLWIDRKYGGNMRSRCC
jgi:uncharacterized short protein YbdD (DUF466 family)